MMRIDPFSFSDDSITGMFHDGIVFSCDRYSIGYGFEPFTAVQQDGETQLDNIAVSLGQTVSQRDIIGRLHRADAENAHVHFALWENFEPICPEPFFSSEAKESILRLVHMDHSDWNICN